MSVSLWAGRLGGIELFMQSCNLNINTEIRFRCDSSNQNSEFEIFIFVYIFFLVLNTIFSSDFQHEWPMLIVPLYDRCDEQVSDLRKCVWERDLMKSRCSLHTFPSGHTPETHAEHTLQNIQASLCFYFSSSWTHTHRSDVACVCKCWVLIGTSWF